MDASEISEHHLQAALSSSQVAADALANAQANGNGAAPAPAKVSYHIPTPEAKAVLMQREYHDLYKLGAYSDPVTYIRTSKTVEESVRGPSYILDEDDNEWLEGRNKKAAEALATALRTARPPSSAKGKNKEKSRDELAASLARENVDLKVISQDEFEMVITVFEQVTSDKVPFAHLDLSKLPTLDDLLPSFDEDSEVSKLAFPELPELGWENQSSSSSQLKSQQEWSPENPYRNLPALKNVAKVVYPWWKNRREDREGKAIMPSLNFDETNDNDPYVCFRRREVKMIRKTRKTDAMHLEKLVRLRHELQQSVSLLSLLAQREKTKRATLVQDKACWQSTRELLEVKKQWNIAGPNNGIEDEELISGEKRDEHAHGVAGIVAINISSKKKRKADDAATSIASIKEGGVVKIPNRKARPSNGEESATAGAAAAAAAAGQASATNGAASSTASTGLGSAILDRVQAVQAYIEREVQRKSDSDLGWEEGSDAAFQPIPVPSHLRSFRPIHLDSQSDASEMPSFPWSSNSPSNVNNFGRVGRPASFRRRVGRGGRIFLDRKLPAPSPVPSSLSDWPRNGTNAESVSKSEQKGKDKEADESGKEGKESSTEKQNEVKQSSQPQTTNDTGLKSQGKDHLPELLTGPFAFSASIRPSQLSSSSVASRTMQTGPFASSPLKQQNVDHVDGGVSDASSSTSSQHSKVSTSTKATSIDENDEAVQQKQNRREQQNSDDEMAGVSEDDDENDSIASEDEVERWTRIQERWRYDDETGRWAGLGLCGLGGMEDDDEAIIDDFDQRFMRFRMNLLEEADLMKLSTDLSNVMQAQAAADTPSTTPAGYSIFRGDSSNVYSQAQQQQAVQAQQAQAQAQQHAQQQAAAQAAALGHPNALARAAQTNVGGPLAALQQQQPIQQAQLQLALQQQQQQRAVQAQAQALANAAAAAAASANQQAGQQQQSGGAQLGHQQGSPNVRVPNGQQPNIQANGQTSQMPPHSAAQAIAHPLAQSFGGVQGLPNQAAVNGAAAAMAAGRFGPNNAHAANLLAQFASGLGGNLSANAMSSPQMQNQLNRPLSSSPVPQAQGQQQQRSSPHIGSNGSYHSSPAQGHAMPMGGAQQGQQRMNGNSINLLNAAGANQMTQMNPLQAAAAIQQAQAALQAQQNMQQQQQQANGQQQPQLQTQPQPQFTPQQLLAMQAALTQNVNMQLKLPQNRNRNLQLAQAQQQLAAVTAAAQASANKGVNGMSGQQQHLNLGVGQQGQGQQQQLSQAQIGMGLLQNLQQQINFAQQNQQHNPGLNAALNAATASMGPNANGLLAVLNQQVNSSPQSKGRT